MATKNAEPLELSAAPGTLSNKKPSAIMMKMRNLSRSDYAAMERAMFLNQLPVAIHTALVSSQARSNDDLCVEADAINKEFWLANRAKSVRHAVANVEVSASNRQSSFTSSSQRGQPQEPLCYLHQKHGEHKYACRSLNCTMKDKIARASAQIQSLACNVSSR